MQKLVNWVVYLKGNKSLFSYKLGGIIIKQASQGAVLKKRRKVSCLSTRPTVMALADLLWGNRTVLDISVSIDIAGPGPELLFCPH